MKQSIDSTWKMGAVSLALLGSMAFAFGVSGRPSTPSSRSPRHDRRGRAIFRFDTFGDEQLWTDVLRMHEVIREAVDPDHRARRRPQGRRRSAAGRGARGARQRRHRSGGSGDHRRAASPRRGRRRDRPSARNGVLTSVGVTCALCHSTVDDSFADGNRSSSRRMAQPRPQPAAQILSLSPAFDDATKDQLDDWGPGKYDPRHHAFDGSSVIDPQRAVTAGRHSADLRPQARAVGDLHRRRTDLVLEQLRRRLADGWSGRLRGRSTSGSARYRSAIPIW